MREQAPGVLGGMVLVVAVTLAAPSARTAPEPGTARGVLAPGSMTARSSVVAHSSAAESDTTCNGSAQYEVIRGDSWSRMSTRAEIGMDDLLAVNHADRDTVLLPGRSVCLPPGAEMPLNVVPVDPPCVERSQYRIVLDDAWSLIADRVGSGLHDLLAANHADRLTVLLPGRSVCIPAGARGVVDVVHSDAPVVVYHHPSGNVERWHSVALTVGWTEAEWRWLSCTIYEESRGRPDVVLDDRYYGLLQIAMPVHQARVERMGGTLEQLFDGEFNLAVALQIYREGQGGRPWWHKGRSCNSL